MKLKVLGSAQDAGVPQIGCHCQNCKLAREFPAARHLASSLAIFESEAKFCHLLDASPDMKAQLEMLYQDVPQVSRNGVLPISGIFLTHAHYGHFAGLLQLGKEAAGEQGVPVYCSQAMKSLITNSAVWGQLVQENNISLSSLSPGVEFQVEEMLGITPLPVPHRNELADTVAYRIQAEKTVLYLPDVDFWTDELLETIRSVDIAFLDGTFLSHAELPRYARVPHPPVSESMELLAGIGTELYFTHLNHTNPLLRDGEQRRELERSGFKIAHEGMVLEI